MAPHDSNSDSAFYLEPAALHWGTEESISYDEDLIEVASASKKPSDKHYRSIQDISMDLTGILDEIDADEDTGRDASMQNSLGLGSGIGDISMDLNEILQTLSEDANNATRAGYYAAENAAAAPSPIDSLPMDSRLQAEELPPQRLFDMDSVNWGGFLENYNNKRTASTAMDERKRLVRFQTQEIVHNYYV